MSEYPIPEDLRELRRWVAVLFDSVTYSDSYGVEGSGFSVCRWCGGGSGPGGNPSFKHNDGCLFDNDALEKKVAGVWEEVPELEQQIARLEAQNKVLEDMLAASSHALRSYQYGNSSEELAKEMADKIDAAIAQAKEQG